MEQLIFKHSLNVMKFEIAISGYFPLELSLTKRRSKGVHSLVFEYTTHPYELQNTCLCVQSLQMITKTHQVYI